MAWYRAGSVAVTGGSPNIIGTGTLWLNYAKAGDAVILPDGRSYEVLTVVSNTSITLGSNYQGTTASSQPYALFPTHAFSIQLAANVSQLYSDFSSYLTTALAGRFGDGSASAPGLSFGADTDTGFYRPGANTVALAVGGAERMRINSNGNVLIGRASETSGGTLEVAGNIVANVPASAPTLGTNGDMTFQKVSDTQLNILVRGSDGVTRSATLTLA